MAGTFCWFVLGGIVWSLYLNAFVFIDCLYNVDGIVSYRLHSRLRS